MRNKEDAVADVQPLAPIGQIVVVALRCAVDFRRREGQRQAQRSKALDRQDFLVEKFVALTHIGPQRDTPLAPLAILLLLVPGPQG